MSTSETTVAQDWEVGHELVPFEFEVTPELNQQYLFAEEDYHERYLKGGPNGSGLVHPALLLNMSNPTRSPSYRLRENSGGLHAKEETWSLAPAPVGARFQINWTVVDTYEKRGRPYKVAEAVVSTVDGLEVMRRHVHETYTWRD